MVNILFVVALYEQILRLMAFFLSIIIKSTYLIHQTQLLNNEEFVDIFRNINHTNHHQEHFLYDIMFFHILDTSHVASHT